MDAEYQQVLYRMTCAEAAPLARQFGLNLVELKALLQKRKNRRGNDGLRADLVKKLYLDPDPKLVWVLSYHGKRMVALFDQLISSRLESRGLPSLKLALDKVKSLEDF